MTQPKEAREALQGYLRSKSTELVRPVLIKFGFSTGSGSIKTNFDEGSLYLRRDKKRYRVLFEEGRDAAPKIEVGKYEWLGYCLERAGKDGARWFASTTGPKGDDVLVSRELPTVIKVDPVIRVNLRAVSKKDVVDLQLTILDWRRSPVTVYQDGERVPAPYEIVDAKGRRVASGNMQYG